MPTLHWIILSTLLMISSYASADLYRYSVYGKCYHVRTNANTYHAYDLGRGFGYSNVDCAYANLNLEEWCDQHARQLGLQSGQVYQDIAVTGKNKEQSSSVAASSMRGGSIILLGSFRGGSLEIGNRSAEGTTVNPIPIDLSRNCIINEKVRQQFLPEITGPNFK